MDTPETVADALATAAACVPERVAFRYLVDGANDVRQLTFGELAYKARGLAESLLERADSGERVVIMCSDTLGAAVAIHATFMAGMVAVPVASPHPGRLAGRAEILGGIVADSQAKLLLASSDLYGVRGDFAAEDWRLAVPEWLSVDEATSPRASRAAGPRAEELALLQYTSGSTSRPKGVMLSHANLMANQTVIREITERTSDIELGLSWLPYFHDMGLSFLLHAPYAQRTCTLMTPLHFMQRPVRWLEALTRYGASCTAMPAFALRHTASRVNASDALDLRRVDSIFIGAEPIPASGLEAFARALAPFGLRENALHPCFGLAESTLIATRPPPRPPTVREFSLATLHLGQNDAVLCEGAPSVTLVGNGGPGAGHRLTIVDPDTRHPVSDGDVGEIWLSGPSIGVGYWQKPEATAQTFDVQTAPSDGYRYLRTGDLGFLHDGELFVVGRRKEMLIVDGRNLFPHDLEEAVRAADPRLSSAPVAVFEHHLDGRQGLGVLIEGRQANPAGREALLRACSHLLAARFETSINLIEFVPPLTLPRTTSGKIRRLECARLVCERGLAAFSLGKTPV